MADAYLNPGPTREEIDATPGEVLLVFGTDWCGHCRAAEPLLQEALMNFADVNLIKVEDGPGRRLGRSFGVKLWPTIIRLVDGTERARTIRPGDASEISKLLAQS